MGQCSGGADDNRLRRRRTVADCRTSDALHRNRDKSRRQHLRLTHVNSIAPNRYPIVSSNRIFGTACTRANLRIETMVTSESLCQLFPKADAIPDEQRLASSIHQTTWLVGGEVRGWSGKRKIVQSPVCVRLPDGTEQQLEIGSYPVMGEAESDQALDAAVAAYDNGRGEWPTMPVADRIDCMQDFVKQMVAQRRPVSQLIMWEIGKSLADSEKEFDRTVDYIRQTLSALKELDNSSSRFTVVEGTIGQIRRTPLGVVLCMGPYNYPLNETFATLIPALLMGNTVVFKPPQYGTLLFTPLLEAFRSAFPAGVINTVYAPGAVVVPRMLASKLPTTSRSSTRNRIGFAPSSDWTPRTPRSSLPMRTSN
jgi:hypothetical protein